MTWRRSPGSGELGRGLLREASGRRGGVELDDAAWAAGEALDDVAAAEAGLAYLDSVE